MAFAGLTTAGSPLPPPTKGPGVYYDGRSNRSGQAPDRDAIGYQTAVCQDPAGSIMLAEQPEGGNICGNDWPSFCMGPTGQDVGDQTPYQIATGAKKTYGATAYGLHGKRFNYLFQDSHVGIHKITDTVGRGTTNQPLGMWTMVAGD